MNPYTENEAEHRIAENVTYNRLYLLKYYNVNRRGKIHSELFFSDEKYKEISGIQLFD